MVLYIKSELDARAETPGVEKEGKRTGVQWQWRCPLSQSVGLAAGRCLIDEQGLHTVHKAMSTLSRPVTPWPATDPACSALDMAGCLCQMLTSSHMDCYSSIAPYVTAYVQPVRTMLGVFVIVINSLTWLDSAHAANTFRSLHNGLLQSSPSPCLLFVFFFSIRFFPLVSGSTDGNKPYINHHRHDHHIIIVIVCLFLVKARRWRITW